MPDPFPPTLSAAQQRLAAVVPADYARTRQALDGAVSRLSPYLTHGLLSLPEVWAGVTVGAPTSAMSGAIGATASCTACMAGRCPTTPIRATCQWTSVKPPPACR